VGDRGQRHEYHAREPVAQPLTHRHRQPGLAQPGQRHQPRLAQRGGNLIQLALAADERAHLHRQTRRRLIPQAQRREGTRQVRVRELEGVHRAGQVAHPVRRPGLRAGQAWPNRVAPST
jgi:hypothetical protein